MAMHQPVYASVNVRLSAYARELKEPERSRYIAKVRLCDGADPLDFQENEVRRDISLFPRVDFTDIKDYLVHATSFATREELKAYKAMESHNYLTSGWVQEPYVKLLTDSRVILVGKVSTPLLFARSCSELRLTVRAKLRALDIARRRAISGATRKLGNPGSRNNLNAMHGVRQ